MCTCYSHFRVGYADFASKVEFVSPVNPGPSAPNGGNPLQKSHSALGFEFGFFRGLLYFLGT